MGSLTIATGPDEGRQFQLARRTLSIGRDPTRDIQLIDPKVSRKHALVRLDEVGYVISLSKALNGMLINGEPASGEAPLSDGDRITLGDTVLVFRESADPDREDGVHARKNADRRVREPNTLM